MRWVPSEINVADKPSRRGLRPFTKDWPHHPAARLRRHVPPCAWRASPQSLPKTFVGSDSRLPSCGHRRSGAQRWGVKKSACPCWVLGATTNAGGKEEQEPGPMPHRSVVTVPRRTDLGISDCAHQTAPSLTWEQGIQTILDLGRTNSSWTAWSRASSTRLFCEGSHSSFGVRLASVLAWAMPQYSRWCK